MESYIIRYVSIDGVHEEDHEGYDQENAVHNFRLSHRGERIHLISVCLAEFIVS